MPPAAANSNDRAPIYRPGTPGASALSLSIDDIDGIWTLSFGRFGWKDYENRGAIVRIEHGRMFGGGSNFVYRGTAAIVGPNAVLVNFDIDRYRADPNFAATTGIPETDHFHVTCIVDALTADHFEGRVANSTRVTREALPDMNVVLVRFGPL